MQAFLEFVVRNLVDFPDDVVVGVRAGQGKTVYELRVNRSDVGKLVGKSGQTIDAIRSLVVAASSKTGERTQVEILEYARPPAAGAPEGESPQPEPPQGAE
jgi:predicted RNA-binding protein YlqC (UPF0109 family)